MKKRILTTLGLAVSLAMTSLSSQAAVIGLYGFSVNIDGTVTDVIDGYALANPAPSGVDLSGFDGLGSGLGTVKFTLSGTGNHYIGAFFDHEIDEATNTYTNEIGSSTGAPAAGQSWEIDEPGWVDGDIYQNFQNSSLDNGIGTSIYGDTTFPDDVSMAMGWDFTLVAGETATVTMVVSEIQPAAGFLLTQADPDSQAGIYFYSALKIGGAPPIVPEPSVVLLLGAGLFGLGAVRRRLAG